MKATEAKLLDFVKKSPQFIIPIYQRTYSWTEKECRQLWDDVIRAGESDEIAVHFVGSIVYIEESLSQVSHQSPLLVIDGQQRLTTATLLIAALAKAVGEEEPIEGFSQEMLRGYYLMNPLERGDRKYKLILSQTDNETLKAIVADHDVPSEPSVRIDENFKLFKKLLESLKGDLTAVCRGLAKLVVVDIALKRDQDNPQLIFESMNSTGKELSQADLIRNYVLMGLEPELQTKLYDVYWRPMEKDFGQEAYTDYFDSFMRNYLTVKTGDIPRIKDVYEEFKKYSSAASVSELEVEELVKDIRKIAGQYCRIALGAEEDKDLRKAFNDLKELKVDVAYPFLLELYADYANDLLSKEELLEIVRLTESYVFRRAVCSIPTNSLNKTFATFTKSVRKESYLESIKVHFQTRRSYRRFPSDKEFHEKIQSRDLYNFRSRTYWLRRLENFQRRELVPVDEFTIEHIMPQNPKLSVEWRESLGTDWKRIQESLLHSLGNLTLTAYNSDYSDRPFADKRDMPKTPEKGFKLSPLNLNQGLGELESWDEDKIKGRAKTLADRAVKVWEAPDVTQEVIESYKPQEEQRRSEYAIEDHPLLHNEPAKSIFEEFGKEVLALDPCVTQEFRKLYVAYKAETNFVDVIPKKYGVRLSLNMKFPELNDPKGIAKDVTNLGRWGNGDVQVKLVSLDEIPYVIGLVRQAIELQLGNLVEA